MKSRKRREAEWIKHDKGFFRLRKEGICTEWHTFLVHPLALMKYYGMIDAYIEWDADYECSACGSRAWHSETKFCPNCGARMDV
jgi:hypothetical protein